MGKYRTWEYEQAFANFQWNVYQLRLQRGWSQIELAERMDMPQSNLARYMHNQQPSLEMLGRFAKVFGVTVAALVGEPMRFVNEGMYSRSGREIGQADAE